MKAKEWIQALVPLAQAGEAQHDAYLTQVDALAEECRALINARLNKIKVSRSSVSPAPGLGFVRNQTNERLAAAYREGLVKWDAVAHGVSQTLGDSSVPFPLFRGALIVTDMGRLLDALADHPGHKAQIENEFQVLEDLARGLGYVAEPIFVSIIDLFRKQQRKATLASVGELIDGLAELRKLVHEGQGKSKRAMELQATLFHLRHRLASVLDQMAPAEKLEVYLMMGMKLS